MDQNLPKHINFWITTTSIHDCLFQVGPPTGPKENIGAIKVFLIGHSEVLRKILNGPKNTISITDSDPETFKDFLKCVYGGVDIVVRKSPFEKLLKLLYLCEKYSIKDLQENIVISYFEYKSISLKSLPTPSHPPLNMYVRKNLPFNRKLEINHPSFSSLSYPRYELSVDDVFIALSNRFCLGIETMAGAVAETIQMNTFEIINHKLFVDLEYEAILIIVKLYSHCVSVENLWNAVLKWAQKRVLTGSYKDLRSAFGEILQYMDFSNMTSDEFCKSVIPSNVLTLEEISKISQTLGKNPLQIRYQHVSTARGLNRR